jgi:NAD+ kinase
MEDRLTLQMVAILYNDRIAHAVDLAQEVETWLKCQLGSVEVCKIEDAPGLPCLREADLLVTLGGDGSILYAAHLVAPYGTPILGINLGRVGFLTEAEPDGWKAVLSQALEGDYWLEDHMMLRVSAWRDDEQLAQAEALNDVVVSRGAQARAVHLRAEVDGGELAAYMADGLIVATPTGSTAYALAAGGPILPPQLANILLVPVAPHLSMERPIVLSEGSQVRIVVLDARPAVLTVDGQVQTDLTAEDVVVVEASPHSARFARVCERTYFYKTLVSRLVPRNGQ